MATKLKPFKVTERQIMVVESLPTSAMPVSQMSLLTAKEAQEIRNNNPDLIVRPADDNDLKMWALAPEIFHDDVPWRGVRVTVYELSGQLLTTTNILNFGRQKQRWGLQ